MTCWAVIPVKAPAACKTRLAGVLGDEARRDLVARMLRHVVQVAAAVPEIDEVLLLGPDRHGLPTSLRRVDDPGHGLNAAFRSAARIAAAAGVDRLVFVSADLPHLQPGELRALAALPADGGGIAPDEAGTGTNALSLPQAALLRFRPNYGAGSCAAHLAEARRIGLELEQVRSPGLAFDVDLPHDLERLSSLPV